jgi:hypothetical protein
MPWVASFLFGGVCATGDKPPGVCERNKIRQTKGTEILLRDILDVSLLVELTKCAGWFEIFAWVAKKILATL